MFVAAPQISVIQSGSGMSNVVSINLGDSVPMPGAGALASLSTAMVSAEQQLQQLQQKQLQLIKLQQQKQKLVQKLSETSKSVGSSSVTHYTPYTSELFPPTPKNTPFFMTPPVTPPNESYHLYMGAIQPAADIQIAPGAIADKPPPSSMQMKLSTGSGGPKKDKIPSSGLSQQQQQKPLLVWPHTHSLFQPPPAQALVIERMHSGQLFPKKFG